MVHRRMPSCVQTENRKRASKESTDVYWCSHMAEVVPLMQKKTVFMCVHEFMCFSVIKRSE